MSSRRSFLVDSATSLAGLSGKYDCLASQDKKHPFLSNAMTLEDASINTRLQNSG
ncbi:MAG: hypothetical protein P8M30_03240 [Planctomycetaceae bacterium]|nr:hypothetical protein [Planctomycetaceae bacterium]